MDKSSGINQILRGGGGGGFFLPQTDYAQDDLYITKHDSVTHKPKLAAS
jgi:hypothetical protein